MSAETEKQVAVKPASALFPSVSNTVSPAIRAAAPVTLLVKNGGQPSYRFAKLSGVAEVLRFKDGTTFQFRLIRRNNAAGYNPTSSVITQDEVLARNLRELAKVNKSLREVPMAK